MTSPEVPVFRAVLSAFFLACFVAVGFSQNVLTYHNNNARTGLNAAETSLTLSNVNSANFGKLFTVSVDGLVSQRLTSSQGELREPAWEPFQH